MEADCAVTESPRNYLTADCKPCRPLTLVEQLNEKRRRLTQELAEVDAALKAFADNPGVERVLSATAAALGGLR